MKKAFIAVALLVAGATGLSGCYLSRQVAGDNLTGGPTNPILWVTVPLDTVLLPVELPHFIETKDGWSPWTADMIRHEYVDQFRFPGE